MDERKTKVVGRRKNLADNAAAEIVDTDIETYSVLRIAV